MAVDERTRHEMYSGLEEKLGPEVADALMAHLPPVGWADVATKQDLSMLASMTKQDLAALSTATTQQFEHVNTRFEHMDTRFDELHRLTLWLFSTQIAMVGLVFTIAKLA